MAYPMEALPLDNKRNKLNELLADLPATERSQVIDLLIRDTNGLEGVSLEFLESLINSWRKHHKAYRYLSR